MYKWLPVFDQHRCSGCRSCLTYCVSGSIQIVDGLVAFTNPEACLSDAMCVEQCANGGIRMEWLEVSDDNRLGRFVDQNPHLST